MKHILLALFFVSMFAFPLAAHAHKPSDSYVVAIVEGTTISGQWDIALRDLNYALGIDSNSDGDITWGELQDNSTRAETYAFARLHFALNGQSCTINPKDLRVDHHSDGEYAVFMFEALCPAPATDAPHVTVTYTLFSDIDPNHRGLLNLSFKSETTIRATTGYDAEKTLVDLMRAGKSFAVLGPDSSVQTFTSEVPSYLHQIVSFLQYGIWHIWTGFDHILFLLSLLLPAVVRREKGTWKSVATFKTAFMHTLKVVTAFTLAHSVTLTIAALGIVEIPSRVVESGIALSVAIAAFNNIYALFDERLAWRLAFAFGLIHGFGFASALGELGLERGAIALSLVSFNCGVEIGQLSIVAVVLPLTFIIRGTQIFRQVVLTGGSAAIVLLALVWFAERSLNLNIL